MYPIEGKNLSMTQKTHPEFQLKKLAPLKLLAVAFAVFLGMSEDASAQAACPARTVTVSNASQLGSAVNAAQCGTVIVLNKGNYGALTIANKNFSGYVTLKASTPLGAVLTKLDVKNSRFIRFDGIKVANPTNGWNGGAVVNINGTSIQLTNAQIHGSIPATKGNPAEYAGWYGVQLTGADLTLSNSFIHNVSEGLYVNAVNNLNIINNRFNEISSDDMKFGGVSNARIENNTGATIRYPKSGAHPDFIQFQNNATNVVIRGNTLLAPQAGGYVIQGIFMTPYVLSKTTYKNITIEQNVIVTNTVNGIVVSSDSGLGSGLIIRNNTILSDVDTTKWGRAVVQIKGMANVTVTNNITDGYLGGTNVLAQWKTPSAANHYSKLYRNIMAGSGLTGRDMAPVPGSAAVSKGANVRTVQISK